MAKIERFEVSNQGGVARAFGLRDQIRRGAVSIMSNIAEGFERGGDKGFIQRLSTTKGSAGEVRSRLSPARDLGYLHEEQFQQRLAESTRISRLLAGFMDSLRNSDLKGPQFRDRP